MTMLTQFTVSAPEGQGVGVTIVMWSIWKLLDFLSSGCGDKEERIII